MGWKSCRQGCSKQIELKHTNDSVRKEQIFYFKKKAKKEIIIISVLRNFFSPIFPSWFSILDNLLIMDSLSSIMKDFVLRFFTMFLFSTPWNDQSKLWFSDVFREYKTRMLGRNKSSWTHLSPVLFFYTHCKCQKTLGLLLFLEGIYCNRNIGKCVKI